MVEAIAKPGSTLSASRVPKVRQQAEEFEGVFLNTLTKTMFESVKNENGFGGGFGEETGAPCNRNNSPMPWRKMAGSALPTS
ncbi:hypothetical protein N8D56_13965 [Devosia sp. A8/3-2]|nr:hypothetical protein N8D56_13965 [Devosia sp. A8/3-2]